MTPRQMLDQVLAAAEAPVSVTTFCNMFLELVGMADEDPYDSDEHPELEDLFDECVRRLDEADLSREAQEAESRIIHLVEEMSKGEIVLANEDDQMDGAGRQASAPSAPQGSV